MRPIDIGSRLELMLDDFLIDRMDGAELRLHHPEPREIGLVLDRPWEGTGSGYVTAVRDGGRYRMWYKGANLQVTDGALQPVTDAVCYAESEDAVEWRRPDLGLFEHEGSTANNIVWRGQGDHGFCPFIDTNPNCPPDERYKAVGQGRYEEKAALWALASPDGIHWDVMGDTPILRGTPFDSQNLVFWDSVRGEYRAYVRYFRDKRCRDILTTTSPDFHTWEDYTPLEYPGAPEEQLYTNQVQPYARAPHIFIGMPGRYIERGWSPSMRSLPDPKNRALRAEAHVRYGTALADTMLMTSRDGVRFRRWGEAFVRPGIERPGSWAYGNAWVNCGLVETDSALPGAPRELSLWVKEGTWVGPVRLRRHTLRTDGFVSLNAPLSGGEVVTKPLTFDGDRLVLNFATSAAGDIHVEIQGADGQPIEGFALSDCDPVFGDNVERAVTWRDGHHDLRSLAGTPIRLRVTLRDADLYSLQFQEDAS